MGTHLKGQKSTEISSTYSLCVPHFLEKMQTRDPHKLFGGILTSKWGPKPASLGQKRFSLLFFSALRPERINQLLQILPVSV